MIKRIEYKTSDIEKCPGVYVFRDRTAKVIYVGKASSLRKRLASYFQPSRQRTGDAKLRSLINSIEFFETFPVKTESEALLLESRFIKEYAPKYNILLRDDKRYLLLKITTQEAYPRLLLTRLKKDDKSRYFGPFPRAGALKQTVDFLTRYFGLRSCSVNEPDENDKLHCHSHIIRHCSSPCDQSITQEKYLEKIDQLIRVFNGNYREISNELQDTMMFFADKKKYENAALYRDIIENIKSLFNPQRKFQHKFITEKLENNVLEELMVALDLMSLPRIIECFDNSNFAGTNAVASMVKFKDGKPARNEYRHFKIKTVEGIDDYASMVEVVTRRYKRLLDEDKVLPDMILIDGGKGQLSSAMKALKNLGLEAQPVFGLAKRYEEIFRPETSKPILLSEDSSALKLLQNIRDEAHRFAINFHRDLRRKRILNSLLDDIPGIGKKRKEILLKTFGSVRNLRTISAEKICEKIPGTGLKLAEKILQFINKEH